jgi:hypothetical protein
MSQTPATASGISRPGATGAPTPRTVCRACSGIWAPPIPARPVANEPPPTNSGAAPTERSPPAPDPFQTAKSRPARPTKHSSLQARVESPILRLPMDSSGGGLYLPSKAASAEAALGQNGPNRVAMHFLREVDRESLVMPGARVSQPTTTPRPR